MKPGEVTVGGLVEAESQPAPLAVNVRRQSYTTGHIKALDWRFRWSRALCCWSNLAPPGEVRTKSSAVHLRFRMVASSLRPVPRWSRAAQAPDTPQGQDSRHAARDPRLDQDLLILLTVSSRPRVRPPGAAATSPSTARSPLAGTRRTGGSRPAAARRGSRDP